MENKKALIIKAAVTVLGLALIIGAGVWIDRLSTRTVDLSRKVDESNARFEKIEKQLGGDTGEITFQQVVQFLVQAQQQAQQQVQTPEAPKK